MIADLKPYPKYKESGLPWLGQVPGHWETRRLRHACEMRVSNVDKHTKQGESPVRLCNYAEVYKNERIRESTRFMPASASKAIVLLNEQKQALISILATGKCEVRRVKGEDGREISHFTPRPSHLMKPSGIPWLGDILQHWEVRRLKSLVKEAVGKPDVHEAAARLPDIPTDTAVELATETLDGDGNFDETKAEEM